MFENISFSEIRIINLVLHIQAGTSAKNYVQLIKSFDELLDRSFILLHYPIAFQ